MTDQDKTLLAMFACAAMRDALGSSPNITYAAKAAYDYATAMLAEHRRRTDPCNPKDYTK